MTPSEVRNSRSGPVLLLGSGPTATFAKAELWHRRMPALAVNDSWRYYPEAWKTRIFVDLPLQGGRTHESVELGRVIEEPTPELAITVLADGVAKRKLPWPAWPETEWLVFHHIHRTRREDVRFSGFELDQGTHGFASGILARGKRTVLMHRIRVERGDRWFLVMHLVGVWR